METSTPLTYVAFEATAATPGATLPEPGIPTVAATLQAVFRTLPKNTVCRPADSSSARTAFTRAVGSPALSSGRA